MNGNDRHLRCKKILLIVAAMYMAVWQADAGEEALPLWELGIGLGVFSLPQYMGSDERYTYPFGFPYLVYRGERWRFDRSGLRNRLLDSDRLSLDVSLSGGLPVRNSNKARQGMPKIHLTGELGPQLNWLLSESERISWSLHLPSRAAINIRGEYVGWVTDPYLRYRYRTPVEHGNLRLKIDLGVLYGSQRYHETYYGVDPAYATAIRPAYKATAGLHSAYLKARLRYPFWNDMELFTSVQVRTLSVGVVRDSPLVKSRLYTAVAAGVVYIFTTSEERVSRDE